MKQLIQSAIDKGDRALSEYASKLALKSYGIPVTSEILVQSREKAISAARSIGYPVVLKACSAALMHKTESGAVAVGIKSDAELNEAYDRIASSISSVPLEGMLVQEMVHGQRELVVGLTRDPQFGPCVMLGLGGILTEIIKDIVFRVAPFEKAEALDMLAELRARAMLDRFRGQAPVDRAALCAILMAVGQIGLDHAAVAEIDINPLIIDAQGRIKAVDALIVIQPPQNSN